MKKVWSNVVASCYGCGQGVAHITVHSCLLSFSRRSLRPSRILWTFGLDTFLIICLLLSFPTKSWLLCKLRLWSVITVHVCAKSRTRSQMKCSFPFWWPALFGRWRTICVTKFSIVFDDYRPLLNISLSPWCANFIRWTLLSIQNSLVRNSSLSCSINVCCVWSKYIFFLDVALNMLRQRCISSSSSCLVPLFPLSLSAALSNVHPVLKPCLIVFGSWV